MRTIDNRARDRPIYWGLTRIYSVRCLEWGEKRYECRNELNEAIAGRHQQSKGTVMRYAVDSQNTNEDWETVPQISRWSRVSLKRFMKDLLSSRATPGAKRPGFVCVDSRFSRLSKITTET